MEYIVETEEQRNQLVGVVKKAKLPFTARVTSGSHRSIAQNNTQHMWIKEIAAQWDGHTVEEVRAHCKLHFGVPILREEWDEYRHEYDRVVKPLLYPVKLALMQTPIDFPVTSLMSKPQKIKYLDAIWRFAGAHNWKLTDPDTQLYRQMVASRGTRNAEEAGKR